jgi:FkbM family methyltransferase
MPQKYFIKFLNIFFRKYFIIYLFVRKYASFFSRFFLLEDGFNILGKVNLDKMKGTVLLDCGSNDGTSIGMMSQYFPNHQTIAFDPIVKTPTLKSNIIFHNVALGSKSGEIIIYTPVISKFSLTQFSSTDKSEILNNLSKNFNVNINKLIFTSKVIKMVTIDSFLYEPFFIKIDVEGYELEVLQGAKNTIEKFQPLVLVEINSSEKFKQIKHFFDYLKYEPIEVSGKKRIKIRLCTAYNKHTNNYVFAPGSFLNSENVSNNYH